MEKSDTGKETTVVAGETSLARPHRNIFDRLRRYGYRKFPSLIGDPHKSEILRVSRKNDEEQNLRTEPPSDELVDIRCIWATEFFTPSQVDQLICGFEKLGWAQVDGFAIERSPTHWIQLFRETLYGGGWFNLGPIHRPGDRRFFHIGRTAPLPSEVEYALAQIYGLTSSITCLVICFILDEKYSAQINESLKLKRQTSLRSLPGGGYRVVTPASQKAADIQTIRSQLRELAANWFRTHLPGIFARGLLGGQFLTCEFLTLRTTQPFPKSSERDSLTNEWLRILGMDNDMHAWEADGVPGFKFAWTLLNDDKNKFHAIMAAKEDAFSAEALRTYGGGGRSSYVLYVNSRVQELLTRWALLGILSGYERHLTNIRDSAKFKPSRRERPLDLLRDLGGLVSQSVDIVIASSELRHFAQQETSFDHDIEPFKPSDVSFCRDKNITLCKHLRKQIEKRSLWLENLNHSVRDYVVQYGTIVSARENIEIQKRIGNLTWVIVSLTIIIAVLTALTTFIAFKAGEISWPW